MSRFEFLSVLVSIVIALGLSEVVAGWGRLLRSRHRVRFDALHAFWCLFSIFYMVQFWWGFWNFRVVEDWTYLGLASIVALNLLMVLAALILVPGSVPAEGIDLRRHFFEQKDVFFALAAALLLVLAAVDATVGEQPFFHAENAVRGVAIGVVSWAVWTDDERLHVAFAAACALLLAIFITLAIAR